MSFTGVQTPLLYPAAQGLGRDRGQARGFLPDDKPGLASAPLAPALEARTARADRQTLFRFHLDSGRAFDFHNPLPGLSRIPQSVTDHLPTVRPGKTEFQVAVCAESVRKVFRRALKCYKTF